MARVDSEGGRERGTRLGIVVMTGGGVVGGGFWRVEVVS